MPVFVPERGDIVWLQLNPQSGHRPALVLSPREYNRRVGLALFCPITSKVKGYPFEVAVNIKDIKGVILSDQVKNLDWQARKAKLVARVSEEILAEVMAKLHALL